jgi:long-chain acyl-CoA synthetase
MRWLGCIRLYSEGMSSQREHAAPRAPVEGTGQTRALATLADLMERLAARGEAPAVIGHHPRQPDVWTAQRLAETARRFAAGLIGAGARQSEVVGLIAPNRPEWIAALLGITRAGALVMPLPEQTPRQELKRVLAHSGCRRIVATTKHLHQLAGIEEAEDLEVILIGPEAEEEAARPERLVIRHFADVLAQSENGAEKLPQIAPERPAALLYTSGTTGTPKAVPLTHANLCSNIEALLAAQLAGPEDRVLLPLPLYHTYPLTVGVLAPLAIGAAIVLPAGITGPQIAQALKDCRCTIMIGVPRLYEAMLAGIESRLRRRARLLAEGFRRLLDLAVRLRARGWRAGARLLAPLRRQIGPELRLLASGGARLDPEVGRRLEALGFEVLTGYGLTETSPILTFNPPGRARIESAGLPVPGVELRIEREGEDRDGEVQACGPNVFTGYWKNPEATHEAFTADGFFQTGDLGHLDEDGHLHLVGRRKELIVLSGGKNVFPDQIEKVLGQSPLVHEVAVLEHERRLVGLLVPENEALREHEEKTLAERMRAEVERLSRQLPSYERLADVALTRQPLPRTHIGKLRRHELPEIFAREKAGAGPREVSPVATPADQALLETPPLDQVWAWLKERFEGHTLILDTSPQLDLGLDSFDWMSLTMELQERFGVRLDEDAIARIGSLRDLLQEIREAGTGSGATEGEPQGLTPEQERWLEPQGHTVRMLGWLLYHANRALMRGLFRLRVEGLEHLPRAAPYLLAPNHASYLDPPVLAACLPFSRLRQLCWAGWTGVMFKGPLTRLLSRVANVVPVDPERGLTSTLGIGRGVLERGLALVWFPEGQRSKEGRLQPFLPGVGWLIEKTGVATVPVLIDGTHEALPPGRSRPRLRPVRVRFGAPIPAQDLLAGDETQERHAGAAERLRSAVASLGGQPPPPSKG